eukprot:11136-Heterococcus_DN1.PRE.2
MAATAIRLSGHIEASYNPLHQADTLQKVFSFVGVGEYLYITTVCSLWRAQYAQVEDTTVGEPVISM